MGNFIIYKQCANVRGLSADPSKADVEGFVTLAVNIRLNIQPAGLEYQAVDPEGGTGKLYKAYTTYSGAQIGMMIATSGTSTVSGMMYNVIGSEDWRGPLGRTYELLLRKTTK